MVHVWLQKLVITPVKKELGLAFKGSQKNVVEALEVSLQIAFLWVLPFIVVICSVFSATYDAFFCVLFQAMKEEEALQMKDNLETKGEVEFFVCTLSKAVTIKKSMVTITKERKKEHQRVFTPSVIEPSFGIGRIIYCLYEHSYYMRPSKAGDEQLNVFRFPPLVAPIKCTVFPLVQNEQYEKVAKDISKLLTAAGISHKIDITGLQPR